MAINESYQDTVRDNVWRRVIELVRQGRIKTVRLVMEELRRNDPDAYRRLSQVRRALVVPDAELARAAGRIARRFPKMSRPFAPREKADQWVVALAEMQHLTVVTQEGTAVGKIPATCDALDLDCIKLDDMLSRVIDQG